MERYLKTNNKVALKSPDHLNPWGTKRDLSRQLRFESKLCKYMEFKKFNSILDLGCSGGAFISNMHNLGYLAIGLEGSDFSMKNRRGPWAYLSNFVLFTCDITKPFKIFTESSSKNYKTDVITSFEVLEHLKEKEIEQLFKNIENHSHKNTKLIFSISTNDDYVNGVNLHQTVKPKDWWIKKFKNLGYIECSKSQTYFNGQYLRGNKFNAIGSFELVLKHEKDKDNEFPKLNILDKIYDYYAGSKIQKIIYKLVHSDSLYNSY